MHRYSSGFGRRSEVHLMDAFLMVADQLKAGTPFKQTCRIFGVRMDVFCCSFEAFVMKYYSDIYSIFIATESMSNYCQKEVSLSNVPNCLEAINVTFQKAYAQSKDFHQKKIWWLGQA